MRLSSRARDLAVIRQMFDYARLGERTRVGAYREMSDLTDGTFGMTELHAVLATDHHVVVLARVAAEREGHRQEWRGIDVYHVADGHIREISIHVADQYTVDEFLNR